jgi:hypothetical protein
MNFEKGCECRTVNTFKNALVKLPLQILNYPTWSEEPADVLLLRFQLPTPFSPDISALGIFCSRYKTFSFEDRPKVEGFESHMGRKEVPTPYISCTSSPGRMVNILRTSWMERREKTLEERILVVSRNKLWRLGITVSRATDVLTAFDLKQCNCYVQNCQQNGHANYAYPERWLVNY